MAERTFFITVDFSHPPSATKPKTARLGTVNESVTAAAAIIALEVLWKHVIILKSARLYRTSYCGKHCMMFWKIARPFLNPAVITAQPKPTGC